MYKIYLNNNLIAKVSGSEYAWEVYSATLNLAMLLDEEVTLENEDGEILASEFEEDSETIVNE